ncbi:MAG: hypothetical protein HY707_04400 [Ignavibacteriae bacterium]|nr:hypothetical protein [Ignavibacteriota bacterium]
MKKPMFTMILASFLFSACTKDQPPPPKQETMSQAEEPKTGAMLMAKAKEKLLEAKDKLIEENKIMCCMKEPCNMCPLEENECDCYKDLKKGEHVCVECYAGWQQGKGGIEGIKLGDVKTSFVKHEH